MVSGLVTSPCDHERIFSGEASWILMASKSVMGPVSSNGLERNIVCVSVVAARGCGCVSRVDFRRIALPVVLVLLPFCLRLWCCVCLAMFGQSRAVLLD